MGTSEQRVEMRTLGDSDLEVSAIGLGCNNFGRRVDLDGTRAVVDAAIDAGITLLDTADIYGGGGQRAVPGRGARRPPRPRGARDQVRDGHVGRRRRAGRAAGVACVHPAARSRRRLRRLRTDSIDLYQYHEPDGVTPIYETLGALDELVREGKVRYIGCSNFSASPDRGGRAGGARRMD